MVHRENGSTDDGIGHSGIESTVDRGFKDQSIRGIPDYRDQIFVWWAYKNGNEFETERVHSSFCTPFKERLGSVSLSLKELEGSRVAHCVLPSRHDS